MTRQSLLLLSGVGNGDAVVLTCRALENDVCSVPAHVLSLLSDGCGFLLALFPPLLKKLDFTSMLHGNYKYKCYFCMENLQLCNPVYQDLKAFFCQEHVEVAQ